MQHNPPTRHPQFPHPKTSQKQHPKHPIHTHQNPPTQKPKVSNFTIHYPPKNQTQYNHDFNPTLVAL